MDFFLTSSNGIKDICCPHCQEQLHIEENLILDGKNEWEEFGYCDNCCHKLIVKKTVKISYQIVKNVPENQNLSPDKT